MKGESFMPSKTGTEKSKKTLKKEQEKIARIAELKKAKELKSKNAVTERLADEATKNIDSTLGGREDVVGIHNKIQKDAEEIAEPTKKLKGGISEKEAEETRRWIEEHWKEEEKERDAKRVEGDINLYEKQKKYTKEGVKIAAGKYDASLTEEERKKIQKIEELHTANDIGWKPKNFRGWLRRMAYPTASAIGTFLGVIAPHQAKGTTTEVTKNPVNDMYKYEAVVQAEENKTEDAFVVNPNDLEGGDGDPDHDRKIQDEHDTKIYEKHDKEWKTNHKHYVKDGEELKSVIRHSLSHLRDSFEDPRDLRNSINELYDKVLTPKEILDLHSFIVNGTPDRDNDALNRKDVEYLQTIYNKIASSPSDTTNDSLPGTLASNSANKETGIDNMYGTATGKASHDLLLNKVGEILKLSGLTVEIKQEIPADIVSKEFEPLPAERGHTAITFENNFNLTPEHQQNFELFTHKVGDFGNFDNLSDFMKNFKTSDFDKIKITGEDIGNGVKYSGEIFDFDKLDDLGTGKDYVVTAGKYELHFDYTRGDGGIEKNWSNVKFIYHGEGEEGKNNDITLTIDEISKNTSNFDKNDPNSQGFTRGIKGFKLDAFGEIKIEGDVYKGENVNEIWGSFGNVKVEVNGWKMTADGFSGKYKTPNGEFDFGKIVDGIKHGGHANFFENVELRGNPVTIENPDGSMKMIYDGKDYFLNDHGEAYKISIKGGEFKLMNEKGEGAIYHGGIGTYVKINGEGISTKDALDDLLNNGAEKFYSSNAEAGISIAGGFIELNTGQTTNSIDQETADKIGVDIDQTFQKIGDRAEALVNSGNIKDMLHQGTEFKSYVLSEMKDLMERTKEAGDIKIPDWSISLNFKTLADNFELIGKHDVASALYKTDILFSALGNDLGNIKINAKDFDNYEKAENKGDFIVNKLWGESLGFHSVKDLTNDFTHRAIEKFGAEFLNFSQGEVTSIVNAALNGTVENLTISSEKVSLAIALVKEINPKANIVISATYNLEGKEVKDVHMNILETKGAEHTNVKAGIQSLGNVRATGILNIFQNHPFTGDSKISGNIYLSGGFQFAKINNFDLQFNDGQGNYYQMADIDGVAKEAITQGPKGSLTRFIGKLIADGKILPIPEAQIGANVSQTFGIEGEKLNLNLNTSVASNIAATHFTASVSAEKDLFNLLGVESKIGLKMDAGKMIGQGGRWDVYGKIYMQFGLDKLFHRYK